MPDFPRLRIIAKKVKVLQPYDTQGEIVYFKGDKHLYVFQEN